MRAVPARRGGGNGTRLSRATPRSPMVRRHRIAEEEVGPVMRAVRRSLAEMLKLNLLPGDAYSLFVVLWRFKEHRTGPPHYPDATRGAMVSLLVETADALG